MAQLSRKVILTEARKVIGEEKEFVISFFPSVTSVMCGGGWVRQAATVVYQCAASQPRR